MLPQFSCLGKDRSVCLVAGSWLHARLRVVVSLCKLVCYRQMVVNSVVESQYAICPHACSII